MTSFVCPKCGKPFSQKEKSLFCQNGHCFDLARQGYVNLLQSNASSGKRHGDDRLMVDSRTDFLNTGAYDRLIEAVCAYTARVTPDNGIILDAGCGECTYTDRIYAETEHRGIRVLGVDISKTAVTAGARKNKNLQLAVASIHHIPLPCGAADTVVNVFAPEDAEEFRRLLKQTGTYLKVVPLENHLAELKAAVYDRPIPNPPPETDLAGFDLKERQDIRYRFRLENNRDIENLFRMTPYYYKTSRADQEKLGRVSSLEISAEFGILVYRVK